MAQTLALEEKKELLVLMETSDNREEWSVLMAELSEEMTFDPIQSQDDVVWDAMLRSILADKSSIVTPVHRVHFLRTAWFRYAAVLLLIAGTATYLYKHNEGPQKDIAVKQPLQQPDIQPGGNKALLTLSDGSTIVLDSAANGALATDGTTQIRKTGAGSLAYQAGSSDGTTLYNTISTPKGGQYQVNLPDGSRVWLNAASSIRFPTAYANERTVEVTGEVYLEIAKDRHKPFFVQAGQERIEILGTSLNVNAYTNEPATITTLLEGSIQIGNTILKPGEAYANGHKYITKADQAIAWKNGLFNFQDADLPQVMRQLERWYDIEVRLPSPVPVKDFYGKMSRDLTLQQVFNVLKRSDIRFTMEGRTLTIQP